MTLDQVTILPDFLSFQIANKPLPAAFSRKENGKWISYSSQEMQNQSDRASLAYLQAGLTRGDKICIISNNRPEWNFADLGALQLGLVVTSVYPTATAEDKAYIINHSESKIVFVETKEMYDKVASVLADCPNVLKVISFDQIPGVESFTDWIKGLKNEDVSIVKKLRSEVKPGDLATMVYTSGTTGNPKGVMLSHNNMVSNLKTMLQMNVLPDDSLYPVVRCLSFLPLCHVFERMSFYGYLVKSASVYYAESIEKIPDNLKEIHPHFMTAVPRLLEKVFDKIMAKGEALTGFKRKMFFWSIDLGLKYELDGKNGLWYGLQLTIARKLVFSKWQEALGGEMGLIVTGGAALQPRLARLFSAAGIRVIEGYGMSETSPIITTNSLTAGKMRFGSVGTVIPEVTVKIVPEPGYPDGEGEVCCKGPNVMMGYYKNPEATADAIDSDGFMHTGDIGKFDAEGFLHITDRKKEIFKTSGGSYIAPQEAENRLKESSYIEQAMVVGENKKFPAVVIVPNFQILSEWASHHGVIATNNAQLIKEKIVVDLFQSELDKLNEGFVSYKQLKKFILLPEEWTIDSGELTPTMKLKRRVIMNKYKAQVEEMYAGS